jgi:four helix bundle protein
MPRLKPIPSEPLKADRDLVSRMRVVRVAGELLDVSWFDAEIVVANPITVIVAGQLYSAVASISANLKEGYSRSSGRDRARFFEYALGSARETEVWYAASKRLLTSDVLEARANSLAEIKRLLLAVIPRERDRVIRPRARR